LQEEVVPTKFLQSHDSTRAVNALGCAFNSPCVFRSWPWS